MDYLFGDLASDLIRQYEQLASSRTVFESHWEEIAARILPDMSSSFQNKGIFGAQGQKRTNQIFDSTAQIALPRFSAIMDSMLTPRNQTWHRVMPSDLYLNKDRQTKLWFEEATRILFKHRYAPTANFASQNQQSYTSLGAFGTGAMYTDALASSPGLRYKNIHLGEIYFAENHQGIIDKAYRYFPFTARQAVQEWGEAVPDEVKSVYKATPEKLFYFLHCVQPREDRDPFRRDHKGMPFASYYVAIQGRKIVQEKGYSTFPYSISRYFQVAGEIYGRSPAMSCLPAIKTLNEEKKTLLKQGHRIVDPVLLAHDDGVLDAFSMQPGKVNYGGVNKDGRPLVHTLPTGNLAVGKDMMDDERVVINDAFMVSLFQIFMETPQMSATEVMERVKEKGILVAPTIGRQQSEYLGPLIERELDLLEQQGLLPPMPPALLEARGEYTIMYDSPLSRSQRAEEASGLLRTVESALNVVNITQNPEPLDHFNWDVIIPELSDIHGVPARWMNSLESIQQLRQGRAEQAQQQQAIQAAPAAAAMMKAQGAA